MMPLPIAPPPHVSLPLSDKEELDRVQRRAAQKTVDLQPKPCEKQLKGLFSLQKDDRGGMWE